MSRLWARLFGRGRGDESPETDASRPPAEPQDTVEADALTASPAEPQPEFAPAPERELEPLAPPEVAPQPVAAEPEAEPKADAEPEPDTEREPAAERKPAPVGVREPVPAHDSGPLTPADVEARLGELLDSLGSAHRRPFVRNG